MRSRRMKREKKEALELDITSLLDILVILLVFLLKSYNASDLSVDLVKELTLPVSVSRSLGHSAVTVQVNKEHKIWVNNKLVGKLYPGMGRVDSLYNALKEVKAKEEAQAQPNEKKIEMPINIVFDQTVSYQAVEAVMNTSSLAGHNKFKFIVQGEDE